MTEQGPRRRLAAIIAADVVGYSRLMQADEAGTLAALKQRRQDILQPVVSKHHGRIVKLMGDGVLVEFASAVDAVDCAVELQGAMFSSNADLPEERRIVLRVGINLGDVMVEGSDLYGDGVNIAARLEALAQPGSVFVSQTVFSHVKGKIKLDFEDLGEQKLKNIAEPVRVYRVHGGIAPAGESEARGPVKTSKPSIAVLPLNNMSGDPEQEYFSDGITEDIITDLSQVSALFVVARNTAFTFKGKAVEMIQAARKLNVSYILEGSVRKSGNRIRITVQLIDGATGGHIWAERYDREFGEIFALQDDISKNVVAALKLKLLPEELRSITARSTTNAEAYERYLQARSRLFESWGSRASVQSARQMFANAAEIDPGYARAHAGIATCDAFLWVQGDLDVSYEQMIANSSKALELAANLAEAHAARGAALYVAGHSEEAMSALEAAIKLDPELFEAHYFRGFSCRDTGHLEDAASHFKRAAELRPEDYVSPALLGDVTETLGLHEQSQAALRQAMIRIDILLNRHPDHADAIAVGAANLAFLGDAGRAEKWAERSIALEPGNFGVRYNAACAYALIGKPAKAIESLEFIYSNIPRARRWLLGIAQHDSSMKSLLSQSDYRALIQRLGDEVSASSQ